MVTETTEAQPAAAQGMLRRIVEVCERPGDTADQRADRSREVTDSILSFQPRDPVEIMFAGMAVTHVYLLLDSMRDISRGQEDKRKARTQSTIVALGRSTIGFLREFRLARTRTLAVDAVGETRDQPDEAPDAVPVITAVASDVETNKAITAAAQSASHPVSLQTTAPEPPASLPLPTRRADTSVVAMMAVLTPANTSRSMGSAVARPAMPMTSAAMMPANIAAAEKFHAAVGRVAGSDRVSR